MQKVHISLKENQKIYFTSDLHIGHRNILRFGKRPFVDLKDMSTSLINNWNNTVKEDDIVFDLGDMFWFDGRHDVRKFIEKLNGTIYKVPGNHDMDIHKLFELCSADKVILLDDVNQIFVSGLYREKPSKALELWISHMPMATWPHWKHAPSFFGHIHSGPLVENEVDVIGKDLILKKNQFDVGVDNWNYTPVSLEKLLSLVEENSFIVSD